MISITHRHLRGESMTMTHHAVSPRRNGKHLRALLKVSGLAASLLGAMMLIAGPAFAATTQATPSDDEATTTADTSDDSSGVGTDLEASVANETGISEYRGELQEPFLCTTEYNGLGQPIIDNQDKVGTPVYPESDTGTPDMSAEPLGWSQNCQAEQRVEYRYRDMAGEVQTLGNDATELPEDIAYLSGDDLIGLDIDGTEIPFLFRYQTGTLPETRFIYSIAMLVPFEAVGNESDGNWDDSHWNERLVYSFGGGVGIGHSQGGLSSGDSQLKEALRLGHGVIFSTGTRTSIHYNLLLGGRVANEMKDLFVDTHSDPMYTIGIGGSGGGIQQYVYNQNHPDLLDGLIPQYSYPDMTTQTINIGDCELLEHYMDVTDGDNERWQDWDNRKLIQGQNTIEGFESNWTEATNSSGSSECIEGWRGATPLALNPTFGLAAGMEDVILPYAGELIAKAQANEPLVPEDFPDLGRLLRTSVDPADWVSWTHWDDVLEVYGVDPETGLPQIPWDNEGVQYGLRAVAHGELTPEEFLDLNSNIGSWKPMGLNEPESCGMVTELIGEELGAFGSIIGLCEGDNLDAYSARQMNLEDGDGPAPRRTADLQAITNVYTSGLTFDGKLGRDVPILDVRHYLEHELDMHNAHQSFTVRERIERVMDNADNHVVWFLDARPEEDENATDELLDRAYRVMDEWVIAQQAVEGASASEAKPDQAVDTCWDTDGTLIAADESAWDGAVELVVTGEGAWDDQAPETIDGITVGDCAAHFPLHSTSRIVAGGPITNDVYKCHLKPVSEAITNGDYGDWDPTNDEVVQLEEIFPSGVCDWSQRTMGYPVADAVATPDDPVGAPERVETASDVPTEHSTTIIWVTLATLAAFTVGSGLYGWQLKRRSTREFTG